MSKRLTVYTLLVAWTAVLLVAGGCAGTRSGKQPTVEEINARMAQAATLIAGGDYQAAVDVLTPLSGDDPHSSQVERLLGEAYWGLRDSERATSHFESALRLDYGSWETHMKLAQMLVEIGKTGRALTEFELALRYANGEALPHYNYGLALWDYGRHDEAIAQWEMALAIAREPRYAQALGMGHSGHDDQRALEYFTLAGELGADDPTFHNNFGLLLTRMGDYRRAETHLRAAVEAKPDNGAYRSNLALLFMRAGRFADAIPQWHTLLEQSPDDRAARIYLGQAYYERKRYADAVDVLEDWLREQDKKPGHPGAEPALDVGFDFLAMSYRGMGHGDRALSCIERAVALAPDDPIHLNNYGVILAESGKIEQARAQWRKVLDIEPDNATARGNLAAFDR